MTNPKPLDFFELQFAETGLNKEDNEVRISRGEDDYSNALLEIYARTNVVYEKDKKGKNLGVQSCDVRINYPTLYGGVYSYERKNRSKGGSADSEKAFFRIRMEEPFTNEDGSIRKYTQPKESGTMPFFNKKILVSFNNETTIDTLFLVEGEKKASRMCAEGFFAVGLMGFTAWRQGKGNPTLHEDIRELVSKCKVNRLVLLTDADTLTITYDAKKDLSLRPKAFYSNVVDFKNATDELITSPRFCLDSVYYMHLSKDCIKLNGKGVDDLMNLYKIEPLPEKASPLEKEQHRKATKKRAEHTKKVNQELTDLAFGGKFFHSHKISECDMEKVQKAFGMTNKTEFYRVYGEWIGDKEFIFKRVRYQKFEDIILELRHQDLDLYMLVNDVYYKKIEVPTAKGDINSVLKKKNVSVIRSQYSDYPDFVKQIPTYDSFCNVPDNSDDYKEIIGTSVNIYKPLKHKLVKGAFPNIYKFYKHLYRDEGTITFNEDGTITEHAVIGDKFTMMMDWINIVYRHPTQILFVPCLISEENSTGKSTLLKLNNAMFGENAGSFGIEEFNMPFNSHYITKLFIQIDEGYIDIEKKSAKERLKKMVTDDKAWLQYKGVDMELIDYFAKIIICTNDPKFMQISENETRWFILKVKPFDKKDGDPDLLEKMKLEIPHFLYYLNEREIFHPKKSRSWFDERLYINEDFLEIAKRTKPVVETNVLDFINGQFLRFRISPMNLSLDFIVKYLNKDAKYKTDKTAIKNYLQDKRGMMPDKLQKVSQPFEYLEVDGKHQIQYERTTARPYIFRFEDWLNKEEQAEFVAFDKETEGLIADLEKAVKAEKDIPSEPPKKDNPSLENEELELEFISQTDGDVPF